MLLYLTNSKIFKIMKSQFFTFLLFTLITSSLFANGFIMSPPEDNYWRPSTNQNYIKPFPPDYNPCVVELMSENTNIVIENNVAQVEIKQYFYNSTPDTLHAYYLFPIPENNQLNNFTITMDSIKMRPELINKNTGYTIFRDIVKATTNPAYWEYASLDFYKLSIYNTPPRERKEITITYTVNLTPDEAGMVKFDHIFSTQQFARSPISDQKFNLTIKSEDKIGSVYIPTHQVETTRPNPNEASIFLGGKRSRITDNLTLYYNTTKRDVACTLFTYKEPGEDGYFLLTFDAGLVEDKNIIAKNMLYAIDVSSNMPADKLAQVKKAISKSIAELNPDDKFNVLTFNDSATTVFPEMMSVNANNIEKAQAFVNAANPSGASNYEAAFEKMLAPKIERTTPYYVVWVSAGDPNAGMDDYDDLTDEIEDANKRTMRMFTVGIGNEINLNMLDQFANFTQAYSTYVADNENAETTISQLTSNINDPVLVNLQLYYSGDYPVSEVNPRKPGNFFNAIPLSFAGRYKSGKEVSISLIGDLNGQMKRYNFDVTFTDDDQTYDFIPKIWASRYIGKLLNEVRSGEEDPEDAGEEILDVADENFIINPYTAHLIIQDYEYLSEKKQQFEPRIFTQTTSDFAKAYAALEEEKGKNAINISREANALYNASMMRDIAQGYDRMKFKGGTSVAEDYVLAGNTVLYKNQEDIWVDAATQDASGKAERYAFGSEDYFNFATKNPEAAPLLQVGKVMRILVKDNIYEIFEAPVEEEEKK